MKHLIITALLLISCDSTIIYNKARVVNVTQTPKGCEILVHGKDEYGRGREATIVHCPCDKYSVGDTILFK